MTWATVAFLQSLVLLSARASLGGRESCTSQGDIETIDGRKLLHIRANQTDGEGVELHSIQDYADGTSIAAENRKIYTYWDYGNDPRPMVALNVQTWLKHAPPNTELVLVNESNFLSLIPDAPKEIFWLPYAASKSDIVRAAVLYHHGGLYLDTDFIVMKPLNNIFEKLEEGWDVVAYGDSPDTETGECNNHDFTSNFMAARKGNVVSGTWWENIKSKLTRTCDNLDEDKVCCHEAFVEEEGWCQVPWGHLEWLKNPARDADVSRWHSPPNEISKKIAAGMGPDADVNKRIASGIGPDPDAVLAAIEHGNAEPKKLSQYARIFCFQGPESFSPLLNGNVYWQKWDARARATSADSARDSTGQYDFRFQCQEVGNGDLKCDTGFEGTIPNFFGRIAHHLFFAVKAYDEPTREATLASDWLAAELIRRSLGKSLELGTRAV